MPSDAVNSLNELVNKTATEILNNNLLKSTSDAVCAFVAASFGVAEDGLKAVQNLTKPPSP